MSKLIYYIAILISKLPFKVLYGISDCLYVLVYHVFRYRRSIVRQNISNCFPKEPLSEVKRIEKGFYQWFCDYFFETEKLLNMTPETIKEHLECRNIEAIEECFDRGQSVAAMLGHYCNWEWMSTTKAYFTRHPEAVAGLIYHPLRSDAFDKLFLKIRSHLGGTCIKKDLILRYLVRYRKENRMSLFGYIADQSPKWENIHLWLDFMNQETPVFTGAERIIRKMNNAVFYCDLERPCRGKYIATFYKMTDNPAALEENELTQDFFKRLEDSIRRQPELYLWTHNRWKRTREEWEKRTK